MKSIVCGVALMSAVVALPADASVIRAESTSSVTSAIVEGFSDGSVTSEAKTIYQRLSQPAVATPAPANIVPEPGTLALLGVGLAGIRLLRRRNK